MKASTALAESEEQLEATIDAVNLVYGKTLDTKDAVFRDPELGLNTQLGMDAKAGLDLKQVDKLSRQTDFKEAIAAAKSYSAALQEVEMAYAKFNSENDKTDENLLQLGHSIDYAKDQLQEMFEQGIIGTDRFNLMANALEDLKENAGTISTDEAEKEINQLVNAVVRFAQTAENIDPTLLKKILLGGLDEAQKAANNVDFNQAQANRAEKNALDRQKSINDQQQIKGILDTVNAVQQLTFS